MTNRRGSRFRWVAFALVCVGCADECPFPDYAVAPIRLHLDDADGEPMCEKGVVVTSDVDAVFPPPAEEPDLGDLENLEVVTYNDEDDRGQVVEGRENLCEHRVHRWVVDAGALRLVALWEDPDGTLQRTEPFEPPSTLDGCGNVAGPLMELQLQRP